MNPDELRKSIDPLLDQLDLKKQFYENYEQTMKNVVHTWSRRPPGNCRVIDHYDTLLQLIAGISDGGDIITSPEIGVIFECTLDFRMHLPKEDEIHYDIYTQRKLGTMCYQNAKTWTLYTDPFYKRNKLVINPGLLNEQEVIVLDLTG